MINLEKYLGRLIVKELVAALYRRMGCCWEGGLVCRFPTLISVSQQPRLRPQNDVKFSDDVDQNKHTVTRIL